MTVQVVKATEAERLMVVFKEGEIVYASETKELWVGDGATYGGKLVNNNDGAGEVTSVAGRSGDVVLSKADITDFADSDYATAAQGALATSAVQAGDNNSVLVNDAGFITSAPVTSVAGKVGVVTIAKADITDFSEGDYATGAEGDLATSATQPGSNVSTLTNDAGYITSAPSLVEIGGYSELTAAATSVNASTHNYTAISGTQTLSFTNVPNGAYSCTVVITAGTITWPANIKWMGGAAPTLTANEDIITLMTVDNGTNWFGSYSLGYA